MRSLERSDFPGIIAADGFSKFSKFYLWKSAMIEGGLERCQLKEVGRAKCPRWTLKNREEHFPLIPNGEA